MPRPLEPQHSPAFFVRGPSPFARLIFFAAVSLTLMATDSRLHYLVEVRQGFSALMHPLQVLANAPSDLMHDANEYLTTHSSLLKQNGRLTEQALLQSAELQRFRALEQENEHLRNLLGAARNSPQNARLGEILHIGRDPFTHRVVINLGSRHEVVAGQAVIDGDGVIGQVTRVYPFTSEVTLITDRELSVPIQVERNSLRAIAFGHGRDTMLDLPYLPANVDIRRGDRLVTSGIDGVYPMGLAVAEVVTVERNPNSPFAHIVCKPLAGIENHKQVLLLDMPKPEPVVVQKKNTAPAATPPAKKAPAVKNPTVPE
ncbi:MULTISPECIES: rod shape-determining protein MreC [Methylovorus]|jgi:rod shape-determining protein MreC|uniref:Cell shape-determining protein MreC n=1 Tax=Methylovorus glucosotrophus (strain SIP3-4) TaxID=582744 RepID=C6XB01_METGS|nr:MULTISPECIES: rod shape-determining protein MreC [Methylovorus]ACT51771.1 rod shape-determining protein MreC [Methylovorus glucosotrophus SIP3-4]ADQ85624.1 rod shape-determining protein MreC [Methylovorus sp. MP688]